MTAPAEPTAPATGAESTETTTATEPAVAPDYKALYEAAQAEADAQKTHNRKIEQRYKNQKAATKPVEPETETDDDPRVKAANATANEARVEARLTKLAAGYSPEALALVDSIAFREEVDELDFDTLADFDEQVNDLIKKKLGGKKKPTPAAVAGSSGGEFAGGSGAAGPITEAQMRAMTPAQRVDALDKGLLKHLL